MIPELTCLEDLVSVCEEYGNCENGTQVTLHTTFTALDTEDNVFFGYKKDVGISDLNIELARELLAPLPDHEVYPELPHWQDTELTVASDDTHGCYIKYPPWGEVLHFREKAVDWIPKQMLQEAQTMEFISKHPHPNIIQYHGCRVKRGRITGLVLETFAFEYDLSDLEDIPEVFYPEGILNKHRIMSGIKAALDHLHSLGWAHNDINPANVMLRDDGSPVLIDFGGCQPIGAPVMSAGTPGWIEEEFHRSEKAHDEYGLKKLEEWLDEKIGEVEANKGYQDRNTDHPGRELRLKTEEGRELEPME